MKRLLLLLAFLCSFGAGFAMVDTVGCAGSTTNITSLYIGFGSNVNYWVSDNPFIASIDSFTGLVHSHVPGSVDIIGIGLTGDTVLSFSFTVHPGLPAITGPDAACAGTTTSLSIAASGGTWSSTHDAIASVHPDGVVSAIAGGFVNIFYFSGDACAAHQFRVAGSHADMIMYGPDHLCSGMALSLTPGSSVTPGGEWSSNDNAIATVAAAPSASYPLGYVTGVASGSVAISYSVPTSFSLPGCGDTQVYRYISYNALTTPATEITGDHTICIGIMDTLVNTTSGGTWSISGSGAAGMPIYTTSYTYMGGSLAVLNSLAAGIATVTYTFETGSCISPSFVTFDVTALSPGPSTTVSLTGPSSVCTGSTMSLTPSISGGSWSMGPAYLSFASLDSSGMVTGVAPGTVGALYYSVNVPGCGVLSTSSSFSVVAPPVLSPITASSPVMCLGGTVTLSDTLGGGTWHSSDTSVIHLGGTTYWSTVASPLSIGTAIITYTYTGMCAGTAISSSVTATYTTTGYVSAGTISGPSAVCDGASFTLSSSSPGGVWTSASPLIATIDATGAVYTTSSGTAIISYEVTGLCNSSVVTDTIAVNAIASPGTISGAVSVMEGFSIPLSASVAGGTWSVSSLSIASIDATSGVLHGLSAGTVTVTYTPSGCYSPTFVTYTVTVVPADVISGSVYFAPTTYTGNIRVWLIAYSAPMLTAIDSVDIYSPGSSAAYQFLNEPAGTYRIKAAPLDGPLTGTGFIPTYFTSSMYWNTADVVTHATGTVNSGNNINLMTGTITSGPGFIGGDVTTGANKGTTTGMPVDGLMMYLLDATNTLYKSTRTDAAGHYSFSNIPSGAYYVFPDSLNYATTPYTGIVITSGSPTYSAASFIQHTLSKTITPIPVDINTVTTSNTSVVVFPNPTTGKVNIAWQVSSSQKAEMIVSDITGRVVMTNTLDITAGAGSSVADLSNLVSGLYTITVKSADLNYNTKIQVQH